MMFGHLMVTAFWAGGLAALLLVVFPTGDPARIWPAVRRYSNIMTVTIGLIVASGLVMLFRLLSGNIKGMWCSDFGVVAGFKMAVVAIAILIGAVNNRVVAYQKAQAEAPVNQFRPRRERSISSLRRLIAVEALDPRVGRPPLRRPRRDPAPLGLQGSLLPGRPAGERAARAVRIRLPVA